ncbi:MAG TPA: glycosyltransferase [Terriglobales bacterium]|nr:glycosyltransferase [Terriglobales bacterium]
MKHRILHVITTLRTGGAEVSLLKLLSGSSPEWEPSVVSLEDEGTVGQQISRLGIPVYSLRLRSEWPNPLRAFTLIRLARRLRPDVIQGWMPHGNLLATLASFSLRKRVPVFWGIHMSIYDLALERRLTALMIRVGARLSRSTAAIIYNSRVAARQHEALGYCAARRVLIPNGFDCQVFHPDEVARRQVRTEMGVSQDTILVGLIARFHPVKDHANFLRAAGSVAVADPTVCFLLAGKGVTGDEPELARLVTEHRLQGRVFLLGERSDMPRLTAGLDVACSSSWTEAFSSTVGEAMACGVPCVATDVGETAFIIDNTGLVVPPRDSEALARAILELIRAGGAHRQQLGAAARRRIESEFSLAAIIRRHEELYRGRL